MIVVNEIGIFTWRGNELSNVYENIKYFEPIP